ncbi:MAG: hypothetical protein MUF87_16935 [Anaerolineae bacterium]|jgi:hypothetical protein|nr:hypothetical protein [Anaerolineae bacterium]
MNALTITQMLALYTWFPLAALLMFLFLITRFYERFSGKRMYFRALLLPMILFAAATVRYISIDQFMGDVAADLFWISGGVLLTLHCAWIYRQMR